jgi:hypothetical protein
MPQHFGRSKMSKLSIVIVLFIDFVSGSPKR